MTPAKALSTEDFLKICAASGDQCAESPILQAYIGGALDLLITLDEETAYLGRLYCKPPNEMYKWREIAAFIRANAQAYKGRNAMVLLVRYFELNGACDEES